MDSTQTQLETGEPPRSKPTPGQMITGQGVFLGTWQPPVTTGTGLGKIFDVLAAPEDLKDAPGNNLLLTLNSSVRYLAGLTDWHGHDGREFINDAAFYAALKDGSYKGEWVIPPQGLLVALFAHRNDGAFKETFATAAPASASDSSHCYWSSTEHPHGSRFVWNVCFSDGTPGWAPRATARHSCRLVRFVAAARAAEAAG